MTRLLRTNAAFEDAGRVDNFTLDLAYGDDENDFELVVPAAITLDKNTLVYVPETEWGGLVREEEATRDAGISWRTYKGPTWQGLLDQRVLIPPEGETHLVLEGDLNVIIGQVIAIAGLGDVFEASAEPCGVSATWQFDRFCTAFEGLRKMARSHGFRLSCRRGGRGKTTVSAVRGAEYIDDNKGSKFGFSVSFLHPVNHYVCVGVGEGEERVFVNLYADANGAVSQTQTIFGIDEVQERYEYTTADRERIVEDGTKSLREKQVFTTADLTLPEGGDCMLDDVVGVADSKLGKEFRARICKVVVKCQSKGKPKTSFDFTDVEIRDSQPRSAHD